MTDPLKLAREALRTISLLDDVLADIADWEDTTLAEAIKERQSSLAQHLQHNPSLPQSATYVRWRL